MAQDPEYDEEQPDDEQPDEEAVDASPGMDMVTVYDTQTIDAEMEAGVIASMLEASGVPVLLTGTQLPPLGFQVQVPRNKVEEAERLIAEAQAAGPEAAAEAEAASEEGQPG